MQTKWMIVTACLCAATVHGQKDRFVTKHNFSLTATGNVPLLSGSLKSDSYRLKNGTMVGQRDWFDYGATVSYTYQLKDRLALGVLAGLHVMEVQPEAVFGKHFFRESAYEATDSTRFRSENVGINKFSFMPIIELYPKNSTGVVGMYYTLGLGYSLASVQKGGYAYTIQGETAESWSEADYYNFDEDWGKIGSFQLLFGTGVRTALTRNLALDFGITYNFSLAVKPDETTLNTASNELFNFNDTYYNFRREQLSYITLKCGISLSL